MLEVKQLFVAYGKKTILRNISLSVQPAEVIAVIGPNGAGKSTLIRSISGVIPIQSGLITVGGHNVNEMSRSQSARLLAVVPQARSLPPAYSVYQAVLLGRTPHLGWLGNPKKEDHLQVMRALELTEAVAFSERRIGELSGGEQQRVLLARALAQQTPVLLLDEPTTHLDLKYQSGFLNLIRQLAISSRLSILMVVHDLNLASLYADRVALLVDGQIQAMGNPENVLTEESIAKVYQIPVKVIRHPQYGTPLILPDGIKAEDMPSQRQTHLFQ